jgi:glycosyltransferase involved in cell wall biosynthesis
MGLKSLQGKLSVVIPCFNEEKTVKTVLHQVLSQKIVGEIVIVDDGSLDKSIIQIQDVKDPRIKLIRNSKNMGKGKSIWIGIQQVKCEYVVIQDSDLEYDPKDLQFMLLTLVEKNADAVYGSRFLTAGPRRAVYYWHRIGNALLTHFSNAFTNIYLTDMETCYKMMKTGIAQKLNLKENRFGVEPEITAKLSRLECKIFEVPISYNARTYAEGKKIGWKDAVSAARSIIKYSTLPRKFLKIG